jgi:hypothetical protein
MGCAVPGLLAAALVRVGPESSHGARSRLARVGGLRWFALAVCGAGFVVVGAVWGC